MKREDKSLNVIIIYFIIAPIQVLLELYIGIKAYYIYMIFITTMFLFNFKYLTAINNKRNMILFITLLIYTTYSIITYRDYIYNWVGMFFLLFIYAFPWYIFANSVNSWEKFIDKFEKNINYIIITNIILIIGSIFLNRNMTGNMEISYSLLPLCAMSMYLCITKKSIKYFSYFIILIATIIIIGSRGPILCLFVFFILLIFNNIKKMKKYLITFILFTIIIACNFNTILDISIEILDNYNLNSRTLYKLKNNTITSDTGRSNIQNVVINLIEDNLILGVGIGGERITVNQEIYNMEKDMSTCYPHNIILEIYCNYGIFAGTIIIMIIIINSIKFLFSRTIDEKNTLLFVFSIEVVRLFISSSYIRSPLFFVFLGMIFSNKKEEVKKDDSNYITK